MRPHEELSAVKDSEHRHNGWGTWGLLRDEVSLQTPIQKMKSAMFLPSAAGLWHIGGTLWKAYIVSACAVPVLWIKRTSA